MSATVQKGFQQHTEDELGPGSLRRLSTITVEDQGGINGFQKRTEDELGPGSLRRLSTIAVEEQGGIPLESITPQYEDVFDSPTASNPNKTLDPYIRAQNEIQQRPSGLNSLKHELAFVAICSLGQFLTQMFNGNIYVAMLHIQKSLSLTDEQLPWLSSAFAVTNGSFVMVFGSLSDYIGGKRVFLMGLAWLSIWSLILGFAKSGNLFIVARAFQGIGCGALIPSALGLLGYAYSPGQRKNRVFSTFGACAPVGYFAGVVEGAVFAQLSNWRWIFWANSIVALAIFVLALFILPQDNINIRNVSMAGYDWIGACFAVFGLVLVTFSFTEGPETNWAPYTYSLLLVGVALLVAFPVVESKVKNPLMPLGMWKTPSFGWLMFVWFVSFGSYGACLFYAALFWMKIQHATPLMVAAYITPNVVVGVLATVICATSLHRLPGTYIFLISTIAFSVGPALFIGQTPSTPYWAMSFPAITLVTFGPDLSFAACTIFVTSNVARRYQGTASSVANTMNNLGWAVFIGLSGVVDSQTNLGGKDELRGYRMTWWFNLGCSLLSCVLTILFIRIPRTVEKAHVD